jgi:hypothetical protein
MMTATTITSRRRPPARGISTDTLTGRRHTATLTAPTFTTAIRTANAYPTIHDFG